MDFAGMNYNAVMLAAAASFIFGGVWYGVLAKQWMEAAGVSEEQANSSPKIAGVKWQLPFTFAVLILMAFAMAGVMGHLGTGQLSVWNGLVTGVFIWLGFVVSTMAVNHAYQGAPTRLTIIDGLHWLCVLLIQGSVIGLMGV